MMRSSASKAEGGRFDFGPRHTKDVKMVQAADLIDAQHYKASTGFSSLKIIPTLTLRANKNSRKNLI